MTGGNLGTRALDDSVVPSIADARRQGRAPEKAGDLEWAEDSVSRWRALALVGAVALANGLLAPLLASPTRGAPDLGGLVVIVLAFVFVLVAALVATLIGNRSTWVAILAGFAITVAVGLLLIRYPLSAAVPIGAPWTGTTGIGEMAYSTLAPLQLGGVAALGVGIYLAHRLSQRLDEEPDDDTIDHPMPDALREEGADPATD
jgi:hypothetical protein